MKRNAFVKRIKECVWVEKLKLLETEGFNVMFSLLFKYVGCLKTTRID